MVIGPEAFAPFLKQELEVLTGFLLRAEAKRFPPGTIDVLGPADEDLADGGSDLLVEITGPATEKLHNNLIPDVVASVWYSCKSTRGKDGWKAAVRNDVDPARVYDAGKGCFKDNASELARATPPNSRLIDAIADGAHYWIVVNGGAAKGREFEEEIAKTLAWHVEQRTGTPLDLQGRVRVCDANRLAAAYNDRPVALPRNLEKRLRVAVPEFLWDWDKWTREFEGQRRGMSFRIDSTRQSLIGELVALLAGDRDPMLRLAGAPGVGKTRLVHHVLANRPDPPLRDRVRYAPEPREITNWLKDGGLDSLPDAILVVDEVVADRAPSLARAFQTSAPGKPHARLIIIGPLDLANRGEPTPRVLAPLARASLREVVRTEMASAPHDEALENTVLDLCEGYPLFALWLSRALAESPALLADPAAKLTSGEDPWIATSLVLAGPRDALPISEWEALAERRGKALLLSVLAHTDDWDGFGPDESSAFEAALELDWRSLRRSVDECVHRGLIRRVTSDRAYISPANLERLVLNHFFGRKPPPLPPKNILAHMPERFAQLSRRADKTRATDRTKKNLANEVLDSLTGRLVADHPRAVSYAAHENPERGAIALGQLVDSTASSMTPRTVDSAVGVLEHLSSRQISGRAFSAVETALFTLSTTSERAASVWVSLFNPAFHLTRQAFKTRFELLEQRVRSGAPESRARAVEALGAAVDPTSTRGYSAGWDDIDGQFEPPTDRSVANALDTAWALLLETCNEKAQEVAAVARRAATSSLRTGIRYCLTADDLDALRESAASWTREERARLAEELDDVERYERRNDPRTERALGAALDRLRIALAPRDLWERILARVGRWHPGTEPIDRASAETREVDEDIALAAELVKHPQTLLANLKWFVSEEAVRSLSFARALGVADRGRTLFEQMKKLPPQRHQDEFLANYLAGWGTANAPSKLDAWLEELVSDSRTKKLVPRVIAMAPGTTARANLLVRLATAPDFDSSTITGLGYWGRTRELPTADLDALILCLSNGNEYAKLEALGLVRHRLPTMGDDRQLIGAALRIATDLANAELPSFAELAWAEAATWLAEHDHPSAFAAALAREAGGHANYRLERAVQALCASGRAERVWKEVAAALDGGRTSPLRLRWLIQQTRLLDQVPPPLLEEWVRGSSARGRALAAMAAPYATDLDRASRVVLEQFGSESGPARELLARFTSTPRPVASFVTFFEAQAQNAKGWTSDESAEVRAWAKKALESAEERAEQHRVEEAFESRYGS